MHDAAGLGEGLVVAAASISGVLLLTSSACERGGGMLVVGERVWGAAWAAA